MVVGGLAPLFCCVDGFIISRLYFLCHNFPKVSELNSKSYLPEKYVNVTSDINNAILNEFSNMKAQSEQRISLRCIDANDTSNPLNGKIINLIIWKYSENGGNFLASNYTESVIYFAYKNGSAFNGWYSFSDDATVSLYQTMTSTNDVLQSAENQPTNQIKFYWLGGAGYTGDIPSGGSYSYGTAIALKRGTSSIFVVIFSIGKPIYNSYTNNSWSGWKDCTGTLISS